MKSNTEIADELASFGQILSLRTEVWYKAKAYQRAAALIRNLRASLDDDDGLCRHGELIGWMREGL